MKKKNTSNPGHEQTTLPDYAAMCKGLNVLVNCLDGILESTGERDKLLMKNKEKVVQAYFQAKELLPNDIITDRLKVSGKRIMQWASYKSCEISMLKKCFETFPRQLTIAEQGMLKRYLFDPENSNLPRKYIWAKARREGLYMDEKTFYKYVIAFMGYLGPPIRERKHIGESVSARKPFTILHMDSTIIKCLNGERVFIHFIMDNYSRKILGAVPSYSSKSEIVARNLKEVISRNRLYYRDIQLYSDDGPENHGFIKELIKTDKRIRVNQIIGTFITEKGNNLIEHFNNKFKHIILKKYRPQSFQHLESILPEMVDYNNNMYLPVLNTLTPNEVVKGKKKKSLREAYQIRLALKNRYIENRKVDCRDLCPLVQATYVSKRKRRKKNLDDLI